MSDHVFKKSVDLMLSKAGEASELAYLLYELLIDDCAYPEEAWHALEKYGYLDKNGKWKTND